MLMLAASKGPRLVLDDRDMRGDALEFQARLGSPKEAESAQILTVNQRRVVVSLHDLRPCAAS